MTDDRNTQRLREAINDERYLEQRHDHRSQVVRRALIFAPGGLILTGVLITALMGLPQTIIMVIIVGIAAIAVDIEAIAALRDLRAQPMMTRNRIQRSWSKSRFLFFGRVHYLIIDRRLFEISPLAGLELKRGDEVEIHHWPHTNMVITLERLRKAEEIDADEHL